MCGKPPILSDSVRGGGSSHRKTNMIIYPLILPTIIKNTHEFFTESDVLIPSDVNIIFVIFMCLTFIGISIVFISTVLNIGKIIYRYSYKRFSFVRNFNEDEFLDKAINRSILFLLFITICIPIFFYFFFEVLQQL